MPRKKQRTARRAEVAEIKTQDFCTVAAKQLEGKGLPIFYIGNYLGLQSLSPGELLKEYLRSNIIGCQQSSYEVMFMFKFNYVLAIGGIIDSPESMLFYFMDNGKIYRTPNKEEIPKDRLLVRMKKTAGGYMPLLDEFNAKDIYASYPQQAPLGIEIKVISPDVPEKYTLAENIHDEISTKYNGNIDEFYSEPENRDLPLPDNFTSLTFVKKGDIITGNYRYTFRGEEESINVIIRKLADNSFLSTVPTGVEDQHFIFTFGLHKYFDAICEVRQQKVIAFPDTVFYTSIDEFNKLISNYIACLQHNLGNVIYDFFTGQVSYATVEKPTKYLGGYRRSWFFRKTKQLLSNSFMFSTRYRA